MQTIFTNFARFVVFLRLLQFILLFLLLLRFLLFFALQYSHAHSKSHSAEKGKIMQFTVNEILNGVVVASSTVEQDTLALAKTKAKSSCIYLLSLCEIYCDKKLLASSETFLKDSWIDHACA